MAVTDEQISRLDEAKPDVLVFMAQAAGVRLWQPFSGQWKGRAPNGYVTGSYSEPSIAAYWALRAIWGDDE